MLFRSGRKWVNDFFVRRGWLPGRRRRRRISSPCAPLANAAECLERRALLSTITVTSLADTFQAGAAQGVTLRDAIYAANHDVSVDGSTAGQAGVTNTIVFASGLNGTISMALGQFDISSSMNIEGNGSAATIIDAGQQSRIFDVAGTPGDVLLGGMTLENGAATGDGFSGAGGAVYFGSTGTLTLTNSTISGNSTAGQNADGGAVFSIGTVVLSNSTVSGNSVTGFAALGVGIAAWTGPVVVRNSTLSGNINHAPHGDGGAIYSRLGAVSVINSTLSGNATSSYYGDGGGLYAMNGDVTITNSTITGNSVLSTVADGGGIKTVRGSLTIVNSIVSGNGSASGLTPDVRFVNYSGSATFTAKYSLIGVNDGTPLAPAPVGSPDANGNLVGTLAAPIDAKLGPLADNGGPTRTQALLAGSPAINAGNNADAVDPLTSAPLTTDQRGAPFARIASGTVDMGAFEVQPTPTSGDLIDQSTVKTVSAIEGKSTGNIALATFTDANPSASASTFAGTTVNWGGATAGTPAVSVQLVSRSTTVSTWDVIGNAKYLEAGQFHVTVTVRDTDGNSLTSGNTSFNVADAPLTDTTRSATRSAHHGTNTGSQVLATFTDANPFASASDFAVSVDWGGALTGAPAVSVQLVSRSKTASYWKVVGSAIYADPGRFAVTVTVADVDGSQFTTNKVRFRVI